jgi:2-methylcitrate dehydratase PrpD
LLAIAQRVEPVETGCSPTSGAVRIELADGRAFDCAIEPPLGNPSRPMSDERLRAKFIDCALRAAVPMSRADAEALCDRILALDSATDVDTGLALPRG